MIHALLVLAVVLFVIWLLMHAAAGAFINLIWLAIIVLVVLWLVGFFRGRGRGTAV